MPEFNIKISELDPFAGQAVTADFFPLVDSSSMTTYRADIHTIASLITQSLSASYVPASAVVGSVQFATSASFASASISASYAKTASWALNIPAVPSSSWASHSFSSEFAASASYASRSYTAYYATRSLDVDTTGRIWNFPMWYPMGSNGNLLQWSPLSIAAGFGGGWGSGPVIVDSGSTLVIAPSSASYFPYYWFSGSATGGGEDYILTRYNQQANANGGWGNGGIQSVWPIVSQTFIGCDQRFWTYGTASMTVGVQVPRWNTYFSGSAGGPLSGSWQTIPAMAGGISQSFNKKWMRIISTDNWWTASQPQYGGCSQHPAAGEMTPSPGNLGGLIKLQANTPVGTDPIGGEKSNSQSTIWAHIFTGMWGSPPQVTILSSNYYGRQLITALRVGCGYGRDPINYLDVQIDNTSAGDEYIYLEAQSFNGGIRFLQFPNWGPWPAIDTASNDLHYDWRQLTVPNAPGHYSGIDPYYRRMNYYIQGKNVVINPTINEVTASGLQYSLNASPYSLNVSGTTNTSDAFYCAGHRGLTTKVTYGTTNLYFSGGILIQKEPPDGAIVTPPATVACGGTTTFAGGSSMPDEQTWTLGSGTGIVTVHFFTYEVPDRLQVYFDGNVVVNTGYRGLASYQTDLNTYLAAHGSASEYMTGGPKITMSFYKNSPTTTAKVQVFGPFPSTGWNYWMSCPGQPIG